MPPGPYKPGRRKIMVQACCYYNCIPNGRHRYFRCCSRIRSHCWFRLLLRCYCSNYNYSCNCCHSWFHRLLRCYCSSYSYSHIRYWFRLLLHCYYHSCSYSHSWYRLLLHSCFHSYNSSCYICCSICCHIYYSIYKNYFHKINTYLCSPLFYHVCTLSYVAIGHCVQT